MIGFEGGLLTPHVILIQGTEAAFDLGLGSIKLALNGTDLRTTCRCILLELSRCLLRSLVPIERV